VKFRFTLVAVILAGAACLAQNRNSPPDSTYNKTEKSYTKEALIAGLEGSVKLAAKFDAQGHPSDVIIHEPLGLGLDEIALQSARDVLLAPSDEYYPFEIRFHLPAKQSRWHLTRVEFHPPEGASRPEFVTARYPLGAGVLGGEAIEEGRILGAIGRQAGAVISFEIDPRGFPVHFDVKHASEPLWGVQAIAVVSQWKFRPGIKDKKSIAVPCTVELLWGPKIFTSDMIATWHESLNPPERPAVPPTPVASTPEPHGPPGPTLPVELSQVVVIKRIEPVYTDEAFQAKIEGTVEISVVTDAEGIPSELKVVRGLDKGLDEQALQAVRQWRFRPVYTNGVSTPLHLVLEVSFKMVAAKK
jgi:TonB family protein